MNPRPQDRPAPAAAGRPRGPASGQPFVKMHGAGNDFVVLDATRAPLDLSAQRIRALADRRTGVGCDQVLVVERAPHAGVDFGYRIFNADGQEVEHCGNGARCFARFVWEQGLSARPLLRVQTMNRVLELSEGPAGVRVDMGPPNFAPESLPARVDGLAVEDRAAGPEAARMSTPPLHRYGLPLRQAAAPGQGTDESGTAWAALCSMGNPHAVLRVADVDTAPVARLGPAVQALACFPAGVNVGFLQVVGRDHVRLRVYERGAGETLACGTGACAAVVCGIALGWLDAQVRVEVPGGLLQVEWAGGEAPVILSGPAQTVFEGNTLL